ncbi:MAG: hypothetical protein RO009_15770 [Pseudorhodoplanes sp.]|jgi:hypothetical protein|nr:hypothetical protein [Pseudorhodoplanes sp.]
MKIVSEQSEEDIRRVKTREALTDPMRNLAANVLRIVRGAGSTEDLLGQLRVCADRMQEFVDAHGRWPKPELNEILNCERAFAEHRPWTTKNRASDLKRWAEDGSTDCSLAIARIRDASLQIAASILTDHMTWQSRAEHELYLALQALERSREKSITYERARYAPVKRRRKKPTSRATPSRQADE